MNAIDVRLAKRKSIQFHRNHRTINQKSISSKSFRIAHLSVVHSLESPSIESKEECSTCSGWKNGQTQTKKKEMCVGYL